MCEIEYKENEIDDPDCHYFEDLFPVLFDLFINYWSMGIVIESQRGVCCRISNQMFLLLAKTLQTIPIDVFTWGGESGFPGIFSKFDEL